MVRRPENDFSVPKLKELVKSILSKRSRTTKLINQLEDIIKYKDVLFYTWKILRKTLIGINESGDIFMLNVLELLEKISMNKCGIEKEKDGNAESEIIGLQKGSQKFVLDIGLLKQHVRKVWQFLISRDMSPLIHRKVLFILLELYLSKIENPIFLTDFFMASLNMKGVSRILALQGVATLMQKHNIEYPNIYGKLYSFFERSVFHSKYKSRLFYLANIFLSSTHLPEALVASFAKRAARLSLTCATPDLLIILRFVGNLLIRHGGLVKMIQRTSVAEVAEDPFLGEESDPMKTRAAESSLWELSLLGGHCQASVSAAAKFIRLKLPSLEFDLDEVLGNSYEQMFESECKKTKKLIPTLTFEKPLVGVGGLKDDRVFKMWALTS